MTSSRHRGDNATIFDVCCEVKSYNVVGASENGATNPLKVLYPPEFSDESILRSVKQFSLPLDINASYENEAVQLFTFVLTDALSLHTFGFCRFTPRTNTCLCILSGLLWPNFFYKLLNQISTVINNGTPADVESLLTNAYHIDIPVPGSKLVLSACTQIGRFTAVIPDLSQLPNLKEDKFLLEFFNAANERQMIQLYASLLKERRIIFTTSKLSQLSSCVFGLSKLFYPFNWQSLFIPILPHELTDILMAPMPYLIGVPKQTFCKINKADLGDAVVMDLDEKVLTSHDDRLPAEAYNFLRNRLKYSSDVFLSDSFARAFLQTNVIIFGSYTSGFVTDRFGSYTWDRQAFIEKQRPSLRPYLLSLIGNEGVQYLERFVDERLSALNGDKVIVDEFEREVQLMGVRKHLDRNGGVMSKPPELIQQAVSSVKENASDVIGALKDQLNSISVRDKFGATFKSRDKELQKRKRPSSSASRARSRTTKQQVIDPLSIDTSEFNLDFSNGKLSVPTKTRSASPSDIEIDTAPSVEDLIDFSDDPKPGTSSACMAHNIYSSPNLHLNSSVVNAPPPSITDFLPAPITTLAPHPNYFPQTEDSSSAIIKRRSQWEKFD